MKQPNVIARLLVLCCVLALCCAGCGGDGDSGAPVNVVGEWAFTGMQTGFPPITGTATFHEDGTVVSRYPGTYTVDGNQITMTGGISSTTTMNGTVDGNTMSGTWTNTSSGSGTWTAARIS